MAAPVAGTDEEGLMEMVTILLRSTFWILCENGRRHPTDSSTGRRGAGADRSLRHKHVWVRQFAFLPRGCTTWQSAAG